MPSENEPERKIVHPPADQRGADAADFILTALDHIRGVQEASGSPSWAPPLARQEASLLEWANSLGLLLSVI
jgi:hypothetical protein